MSRCGKWMRACAGSVMLVGAVMWALPARAQETAITADQAAAHVGQMVTVCGEVASARYLANTNKRPTFLNLGKAYPDHDFSVVIMGENRAKFPEAPEQHYRGKRICVKGTVRLWHGKPEIEVTDPTQLWLDPSVPDTATEQKASVE